MATQTKYDASVLQREADRLYAQANSKLNAVSGCLGVGFLGFVLVQMFTEYSHLNPDLRHGLEAFGALAGAFWGYFVAKAFSDWIRVKAQLILCQMQTELNSKASE
jgi:hypothetical protein